MQWMMMVGDVPSPKNPTFMFRRYVWVCVYACNWLRVVEHERQTYWLRVSRLCRLRRWCCCCYYCWRCVLFGNPFVHGGIAAMRLPSQSVCAFPCATWRIECVCAIDANKRTTQYKYACLMSLSYRAVLRQSRRARLDRARSFSAYWLCCVDDWRPAPLINDRWSVSQRKRARCLRVKADDRKQINRLERDLFMRFGYFYYLKKHFVWISNGANL